ncbi:MAG TPA: arginase family protein [Candidatus Limnocylindrales bacterium]|nr:arginase family protein [Candidatus Limnocylindrales bacterium]
MDTDSPLIGNQASLSYPFAGIPSFLRAPIEADLSRLDADVAVLGIPSDEGSPFMPGSRFGPRRIREHSLRFGSRGYYDAREERMFLDEALGSGDIVDVGDVDVLPTAAELTWTNITDSVGRILDRGAMPLIIGGDHAVSAPVVRAWKEPVHVIHFDAHIDYSPFQHGFMYTNTHPFRHIRAMPHVQSLTQLGIRSIRNSRQAMHDAVSDGNRVLAVDEFRDLKATGILGGLPADAPVYVSIDIDVLDMSLVPGCVSAEPSGLVYDELREMLVAIAEHTNVVGFDLVEVNPLLDVGTGVTSYLAAHTIIEFLGHICAQPRWTQRRDERAERRRNAEAAS